MHLLLYLRLVVLTAGTLLPFFWMVVILGHRRQRNFERIFFFLMSVADAFFRQLPAGAERRTLLRRFRRLRCCAFAWTLLCLGLWFIPPLVVHLHVEYAAIRNLLAPGLAQELPGWCARGCRRYCSFQS